MTNAEFMLGVVTRKTRFTTKARAGSAAAPHLVALPHKEARATYDLMAPAAKSQCLIDFVSTRGFAALQEMVVGERKVLVHTMLREAAADANMEKAVDAAVAMCSATWARSALGDFLVRFACDATLAAAIDNRGVFGEDGKEVGYWSVVRAPNEAVVKVSISVPVMTAKQLEETVQKALRGLVAQPSSDPRKMLTVKGATFSVSHDTRAAAPSYYVGNVVMMTVLNVPPELKNTVVQIELPTEFDHSDGTKKTTLRVAIESNEPARTARGHTIRNVCLGDDGSVVDTDKAEREAQKAAEAAKAEELKRADAATAEAQKLADESKKAAVDAHNALLAKIAALEQEKVQLAEQFEQLQVDAAAAQRDNAGVSGKLKELREKSANAQEIVGHLEGLATVVSGELKGQKKLAEEAQATVDNLRAVMKTAVTQLKQVGGVDDKDPNGKRKATAPRRRGNAPGSNANATAGAPAFYIEEPKFDEQRSSSSSSSSSGSSSSSSSSGSQPPSSTGQAANGVVAPVAKPAETPRDVSAQVQQTNGTQALTGMDVDSAQTAIAGSKRKPDETDAEQTEERAAKIGHSETRAAEGGGAVSAAASTALPSPAAAAAAVLESITPPITPSGGTPTAQPRNEESERGDGQATAATAGAPTAVTTAGAPVPLTQPPAAATPQPPAAVTASGKGHGNGTGTPKYNRLKPVGRPRGARCVLAPSLEPQSRDDLPGAGAGGGIGAGAGGGGGVGTDAGALSSTAGTDAAAAKAAAEEDNAAQAEALFRGLPRTADGDL
jgi:hypothetical protein